MFLSRLLVVLSLLIFASPAQAGLDLDRLGNAVNRDGPIPIIVTFADPDNGPLSRSVRGLQTLALGALGWTRLPDLVRFDTFAGVALLATPDRIADLQRQSPLIDAIFEDRPLTPTLNQSRNQVKGDQPFASGGSGVSVAVLDTGVDTNHPWLKDAIVAEACFGTNMSWRGNRLRSACPDGKTRALGRGAGAACSGAQGCDHGTHVAGIVASRDRRYGGIADLTDIVAVQVFSLVEGDLCGGQDRCVTAMTSDIIKALEWVLTKAKTHQIAAVNMSLGGGKYARACDGDSAFSRITQRYVDANIPLIAAAGNDGFDGAIADPACVADIISVGAVDRSDRPTGFTNQFPELDLFAPGSQIVSAVPGGRRSAKSGTSMAAPHVAGAVAVLKAADPSLSYARIRQVLQSTGPWARAGADDEKKRRLNLAAALEAIGQGGKNPPPPSRDEPPKKEEPKKKQPGLLDGVLGGGGGLFGR